MQHLSSSISAFHLTPEGGESSELPHFQPEDDNIDHADEFFTPPQSPAEFQWQSFNMGDFEILSREPASSLRAPPPTPITDELPSTSTTDAPPPPPITEAQPDSEEAIQFWRSEFYGVTTNFPPSELPENSRNGSWHPCLPTSPNGELAVLFGPEPAIPFTWVPTRSDDDVPSDIGTGLSKYTWGAFDTSALPLGWESIFREAENKDSPRVVFDEQVRPDWEYSALGLNPRNL